MTTLPQSNLFQPVADLHQADVYMYAAEISDQNTDCFILTIKQENIRAKNCVLFLSTFGGSADAAFRAVRAVRRYYKNGQFIVYVLGQCKSAGTLLAIGADKMFMGDFGELGPLDVQLQKKDTLFARESGVNHLECTKRLFEQMFECFESAFLRFSGAEITTITSADIASKITVGLFAPISAQIDPMSLANSHRAIMVAEDYGNRIARLIPEETRQQTINTLINGYRAHNFVIDYEEARKIFGETNVNLISSQDELAIEKAYFYFWKYPFLERQSVRILARPSAPPLSQTPDTPIGDTPS